MFPDFVVCQLLHFGPGTGNWKMGLSIRSSWNESLLLLQKLLSFDHLLLNPALEKNNTHCINLQIWTTLVVAAKNSIIWSSVVESCTRKKNTHCISLQIRTTLVCCKKYYHLVISC
jgi:hypothetical protein